MRHLSDLRRKQLDLVAAVLPPFANGRYWTVATAVYADADAARAQARFARQQGLQHDAFVWRVPISRLARLSSPYAVTPASAAMPAYPDLLMSPRGDAADEDRYFVFLGSPGSEEEIVGAGQAVRAKYPGINVAAFPPLEPGGLWRLVHRRVQTIHLGEDRIGGFGPLERCGVLVVLGDVAVDRGLQVHE